MPAACRLPCRLPHATCMHACRPMHAAGADCVHTALRVHVYPLGQPGAAEVSERGARHTHARHPRTRAHARRASPCHDGSGPHRHMRAAWPAPGGCHKGPTCHAPACHAMHTCAPGWLGVHPPACMHACVGWDDGVVVRGVVRGAPSIGSGPQRRWARWALAGASRRAQRSKMPHPCGCAPG